MWLNTECYQRGRPSQAYFTQSFICRHFPIRSSAAQRALDFNGSLKSHTRIISTISGGSCLIYHKISRTLAGASQLVSRLLRTLLARGYRTGWWTTSAIWTGQLCSKGRLNPTYAT
ncbi:hypothetical protein ARMSODRAFT_1037761, partial [Armillaria solidipes]